MVSDAHRGLENTTAKAFGTKWSRYPVRCMKNALGILRAPGRIGFLVSQGPPETTRTFFFPATQHLYGIRAALTHGLLPPTL